MNNSNQSKQVLLSVIGVAILVVAVVGVSFAFFSYVNTGSNANTVETGTISFSADIPETAITITNVFPTATAASDTVTVTINGSTTYNDGIIYVVDAVEPTQATELFTPTLSAALTSGTQTGHEFNAAGSGSGVSLATSGNTLLGTGSIAKNTTVNNAQITITVGFDSSKYWISDNVTTEMSQATRLTTLKTLNAANGLTVPGDDAVVYTTSEWNALSENGVSFKIRVRATEGTEFNGTK